MKRRLTLSLLAVIILALVVPSFLAGREGGGRTLYVISPHWEGIKYEFKHGFEAWYAGRKGERVRVEWVDIGGSGRIRRFLEGEVSNAARTGTPVDIDVIFGGGDFMFRGLAKAGVLEAVPLPPEIADDLPVTYSGIDLRDPQDLWFGAALSTFGIVSNRVILQRLHLREPREWADLADTRLFSWVAAADMQTSGTAHTMYEVILQAYGWEKGFALLTHLMGNARYITQASSDVPEDIARGDVACGLAIDFYAERQVSLHGKDRIGFVAPARLTIVNADPIGKVRNCASPDLADAFVTYVLSEEGQRLWCYRKDETGGPRRFELGRLPIRGALYRQAPARFPFNPFSWRPDLKHDGRKAGVRWDALEWFLGAAFVANHERLAEAWKAVIEAGLPPDLLEQLDDPLVTEQQLLDLAGRTDWNAIKFRQHAEWVGAFREKYRRVAREARQRRPA